MVANTEGIESITVSTENDSVTLTPETSRRINDYLARQPIRIPAESTFIEGKHQADFIPAEQLERLATKLIERHPARFGHLASLRVIYLWKRTGGKQSGKAVFGKCEKPSGLARFFSGGEDESPADFVVWLAADHCREVSFSQQQIEALFFHELCHAGYDQEKEKPELIAHDFEGFRAEIEQYGFWQEDLETMAEAVQFRLPSPAEEIGRKLVHG